MAATFLFLLVGVEYFLVPAQVAGIVCKPCFATTLNDTKWNYTAIDNLQSLYHVGCPHAPSNKSHPSEDCIAAARTPLHVSIIANVNDTAYLNNADMLMLASCMFHAAELMEKGLQAKFSNVSGVLAVCVNFTDYARLLRSHVGSHDLTIEPVRLFHFLTPSTMRWATTIACIISILLAI